MGDSGTRQKRFENAVTAHGHRQMDRARALYRQLLREAPEFAGAIHGLGLLELQTGNAAEGVPLIEKSVRLEPNNAQFQNNLGETYRQMKRMMLATECFRKAIALDPNLAPPHSNLANVFQSRGNVRQAIEEYRNAIALDPAQAVAHSNLLLTMHFDPSATPAEIFAEHLRWAEVHGKPSVTLPELPPLSPDDAAARRLRVGYLSPDFAFHPVAFFFEPILENHDHSQFEVFCYSDVPRADDVTARMKAMADQWRDSTFWLDQQLAEQIRKDKIDILIELAGHTARNRMPMLAARLAPLQISYLGYPDTTGLKSMDYRITDSVLNPPGRDDQFHTEKLFRLPGPFASYRPFEHSPQVQPPPVSHKGYITFGCPTRLEKLAPDCIRWWAQVLRAVPQSRLLLMSMPRDDAETFAFIGSMLSECGIDLSRVNYISRQTFPNYQLAHHSVDIVLGTYPSNGHTIVCHALWMGVPVIGMSGDNYISRLTASVLTHLRLPELIATTPEQYVQIAVGLANDIPRLTELRRTMRQRMIESPLMDFPGFTRDFESGLHQMWQSRVADAADSPGQSHVPW